MTNRIEMHKDFLPLCFSSPISTELTLTEYFSNGVFWSCFLNMVGHVQFELSDVFPGSEPG